MIFSPMYLLLLLVTVVISGAAGMLVKGTFAKYSRQATRSHLTGAEIARSILRDNDINDVTVEPVPGKLSDHYDPRTKTLRLSEDVYASNSMAAFGVAAHEVGHAIQHANGYAPLKFRSAWVPVASTGSNISIFVIIAAFFLGGFYGSGLGPMLAWTGLALFATTTLFTLITLPVEFDASRRALVALEHGGYMARDEVSGARSVLRAASLTYVAAFITSLLTLLYWAHMLGLFGRRS